MRFLIALGGIVAALYFGLIDNLRKAEFEAPFAGYVDATSMGNPALPSRPPGQQPTPGAPEWLYLDHLGSRFVNPKALGTICPELLQIAPAGTQANSMGKPALSHWLERAEPYDKTALTHWTGYSWGNMVRIEGVTIPMSSLPEPERCPWLSATKSGNIGIDGRHLVVLLKFRPAPSSVAGPGSPAKAGGKAHG